jgi:hypothetical protein
MEVTELETNLICNFNYRNKKKCSDVYFVITSNKIIIRMVKLMLKERKMF